MNAVSTNIIKEIKDFAFISEIGNEIYFNFTESAINILKRHYIALDNEIAKELKNIILSDEDIDLSDSSSIVVLIDNAEKQVYCEQFIKEIAPNLNIVSYTISSNFNETNIETKAVHCNRPVCTHCLSEVLL